MTVTKWCDTNSLTFNVSKTRPTLFKGELDGIFLKNEPLLSKQDNKFLGLSIGSDLRFEGHVVGLSAKLASSCYALRVISHELGPQTARNVYFSIIESHLSYGICFWGVCPQYLFNIIFTIQKRALRHICGAYSRDSCRPQFVTLKIFLACIYRYSRDSVSNSQNIQKSGESIVCL